MRFLVKVYDDGGMFAVETSDDGSTIASLLVGTRQVDKRLSAFVEVLGDDTPEGAQRIQDALDFLSTIVRQRSGNLEK